LSLLAPVKAAVLPASRILSGLPELFPREPAIADRSSAMAIVTGPSRTADIELTRTIGVHGLGKLHVVILEESEATSRCSAGTRARQARFGHALDWQATSAFASVRIAAICRHSSNSESAPAQA